MEIRESITADNPDIETIHIHAFGKKEGTEIAELIHNLFEDKTALPLFSLVAIKDGQIVGHILYTNAIVGRPCESVPAQYLVVLGILPEVQHQGIGAALVNEGLKRLRASGVRLVFVLGHQGYYPRYGFRTAGDSGFEPPYPLPEKETTSWMVVELQNDVIGKVGGKVQCAKALDKPQYWQV